MRRAAYAFALVAAFVFATADALAEEDKSLERIIEEARAGDPFEQLALGTAHRYGIGVERDPVKAARWLKAAAERGLGRAMLEYAELLASGRGPVHDPDEAMRWFRKAAERYVPEARDVLRAAAYFNGRVPKNAREADRWFEEAAQDGDPEGAFEMCKAPVPNHDLDETIGYCMQAAGAGHGGAALRLGLLSKDRPDWSLGGADRGFASIKGFYVDEADAKAHLTRSADAGHAGGKLALALWLLSKEPSAQSDAKAFALAREAADLGNPTARTIVGLMRARGRGTARDDRAALADFNAAARDGDTLAFCSLAHLYGHGRSVPIDLAESEMWTILAARDRHRPRSRYAGLAFNDCDAPGPGHSHASTPEIEAEAYARAAAFLKGTVARKK